MNKNALVRYSLAAAIAVAVVVSVWLGERRPDNQPRRTTYSYSESPLAPFVDVHSASEYEAMLREGWTPVSTSSTTVHTSSGKEVLVITATLER